MTTDERNNLEPLYDLLKKENTHTTGNEGGSVQRAILKKYFKASRVQIKPGKLVYDIKIWPMLSTKRSAAFDFKIPQSQMYQFLKSCIKNDTQGRSFYTAMMQYLMLNKAKR